METLDYLSHPLAVKTIEGHTAEASKQALESGVCDSLVLALVEAERNYLSSTSPGFIVRNNDGFIFTKEQPECDFISYRHPETKPMLVWFAESLKTWLESLASLSDKVIHYDFILTAGGSPQLIDSEASTEYNTLFLTEAMSRPVGETGVLSVNYQTKAEFVSRDLSSLPKSIELLKNVMIATSGLPEAFLLGTDSTRSFIQGELSTQMEFLGLQLLTKWMPYIRCWDDNY